MMVANLGWKFSGYYLVVAIACSIFFVCFSNTDNKRVKFGSLYKERSEVVEIIREGKLKQNQYGLVDLPPNYKELKDFGDVLVVSGREGQVVVENQKDDLVVFFRTSFMKNDFDGFVFDSGNELPLAKDRFSNLLTVKKIRDHWFYISTFRREDAQKN